MEGGGAGMEATKACLPFEQVNGSDLGQKTQRTLQDPGCGSEGTCSCKCGAAESRRVGKRQPEMQLDAIEHIQALVRVVEEVTSAHLA